MLMESIYNLPKIQFVGGETQPLYFHLKTPSGENYKTSGYDADFALSRWGNKSDEPVLTKNATVTLDSIGKTSVIEINLTPEDTVGLRGRYIYQITIIGQDGFVEIPGQGIFEIVQNIHPNYITQL